MKNKNTLKVRFLGGVGEIGKNITVLEYQKDIIVIKNSREAYDEKGSIK